MTGFQHFYLRERGVGRRVAAGGGGGGKRVEERKIIMIKLLYTFAFLEL